MPRSLVRFGLVAGIVFAFVLLAACGGGDDEKGPSGSGSGQTSNATATAGPASTGGGSEQPAAPDGLIAAKLLDAAGFASALGEQVTTIEDNGTYPDQYGCEVSGAQVLTTTSGVVLTMTLWSEKNSSLAATIYQQNAGGLASPTPIAGVDQGGTANGTALMQKGAQVLKLETRLGDKAESEVEQIKASGGDPTQKFAELTSTGDKAVPALAAALPGTSCNGPSQSFAAGALPPCPVSVKDLESGLGVSGAKATPAVSDSQGYQECLYDLGDQGSAYYYTTTEEQLQASIEPRTASDEFQAQLAADTKPPRASQYETFAEGRFQGVSSISSRIGIDTWVYFDGDAAATSNLGAGAVQQALLRTDAKQGAKRIVHVEETSSGQLIKRENCREFMKYMMDGMLGEIPNSSSFFGDIQNANDYKDALDKLTDACEKGTGG